VYNVLQTKDYFSELLLVSLHYVNESTSQFLAPL